MERRAWIVTGALIVAVIAAVAIRVGDTAVTPFHTVTQVVGDSSADVPVRRQDEVAQSSLRNALVAAKTIWTDMRTYVGADESPTGLVTIYPNLTYTAADTRSTGPYIASVNAVSRRDWAAAAMSLSGTCYWIRDSRAGTWYGTTTRPSECTGTAAADATDTHFP